MNKFHFNSRSIILQFYKNEGRRNKTELILQLEESSINDFRIHNEYKIFHSILILFYLFYRGDRVQKFSLLNIRGMTISAW